ncbi:hypothetical protein FHR32_005559 [Streptosporangium album]|uniref:Uncharacterized protein n=1 Tax=Streptosporangium album TaxID=47479 RepID=A0A7W7S0B3_9ACTN|nr:hypothetical protein [Streptosporangium album]MBB4941182.1 hypothetical protein [Streptosporangium album]
MPAVDWVTVTPHRFRLAAGESTPVSARISVPSDPEPGDHQLALVLLMMLLRRRRLARRNAAVRVPSEVEEGSDVTQPL